VKNEAIKKPNKITYEVLWKAIIRPPRDEYLEEELGSPNFTIENKRYIRKDFELLNFQGYLLKVSMIEPDPKERPQDIMPCVIYLHANASSRIEGLHIRRFLLKRNINLCIFDFQGSGLSEGEYISLGYHEKHQVKNIVDFVEKYPGVGKIGLWGRSMGAATTLIYANMDKRIKAIVVDSPFEDFRKLAKEMVLGQIKLPGFLVEGAISIIGKV
jgi:dipeptidyl aminopeptidase/acylaminoacyl peptidase